MAGGSMPILRQISLRLEPVVQFLNAETRRRGERRFPWDSAIFASLHLCAFALKRAWSETGLSGGIHEAVQQFGVVQKVGDDEVGAGLQ